MKILHVIPSISPLRGGPSTAVLEMVAALRGCDVDAAILTTNDHGPGLDHTLPLGRWCERSGVPVLAFPRWSPPLAPLREYAISPALNRWLGSHIRQFDLLHVHALFSWPSSTAMLQARRAAVPFVLSTIGQLNHWSLARHAWRKRLMLALLDRRNLAGAAALHFASEAERLEAADIHCPAPALVLPLGVHLPAPAPLPPHRPPDAPTHFLFLSRIHPKKQLNVLLEALALLQQRLPQAAWRLTIAGNADPSYLRSLQALTRHLHIDHRCSWPGFVEGNAKWVMLRSADWFVLPSASENFGIAAIEALAAGTPPILSREVAVAEDIAAAGAGVMAPSDPHGLASLLCRVLEPPTPAMRCAARALAEQQYSWTVIGARLRQGYAAILDRKPSCL